jgi:hypothetical protein
MDTDRNIVLIYNDEESRLIAAVPAIPASHLERSGRTNSPLPKRPRDSLTLCSPGSIQAALRVWNSRYPDNRV